MLVCLECQFENPDDNKFCQKCGASLTERACPSCGTTVALDAISCGACGTMTGSLWRAIVQPPSVDDKSAEVKPSPATVFSTSDERHYLGSQRRYQLLDALPTEAIASVGSDARVLDCYPLRPSYLEIFCQEPGESAAALPEDLSIPAIALDYLELEQQLYPSLPTLKDAWEEAGYAIIILEDRQNLPALAEFWKSHKIAPLQVLHLFHQIAELWTELQTRGYTESMLRLNNLRIDEDQLLYLQRLYADAVPSTSTLKALGNLWWNLLQVHPDLLNIASLKQLCLNMQTELVATADVLRAQLEAIATELQTESKDIDDDLNPIPTEGSGETTEDLSDNTCNPEAPTLPPVVILPESTESLPAAEAPPPEDAEEEEEEGDWGNDTDDIPTIVLPMILVNLEEAGRSDVGRQRDHNEDYFYIQTAVTKSESIAERKLNVRGLYILCDGMGGHASGEVASEAAASALKDYFAEHWQDDLPSEAIIRQGVLTANHLLFEMNQKNESSGSGRMGTTLVMLLIHGTKAAIAHVGDSRLYRFSRRQGLEQVTTDHEVGQREIQRGVEPSIAYARPDAYQLTQALGPRDEPFVNPDVQFLELNEDLLLLLCSDGLTDNDLLEKHCETHVEPILSSQTTLEQGVNGLIDLANKYNGHDNITAVVVRAKVRPDLAKLRRP